MTRAIVFDLDGTLVDSAPDLHAAACAMLDERGLPPVTLDQVKSFVGNGIGKLVERCLDAVGYPDDPPGRAAALESFRAHYGADPAALTRPYTGVETMLADLAGDGYALGVCTNKPVEMAVDLLRQLGLFRYFGSVVGGGTVAALKPDPAPLVHCLAALGAATALYVGDSETDAATARAAGVPFALYSGGYRKSAVEAFEAAFVFDRFEALAPHVRELAPGGVSGAACAVSPTSPGRSAAESSAPCPTESRSRCPG